LLTSTPSLQPAQARTILDRASDPVWFAANVLGHDPWDVPRRIMRSVSRPQARVAVKACHSSAKTYTAAEIVLWWVIRMRGIAITTAPTWPQVEKLLWGEIHKAYDSARIPLGGSLTQTELKLSADCYAMGLSTDQGVRFQGFHGTVLIVLDEAPGVRPDIFEAIEGVRAGGDVRILMLGNPTIAAGPFYDAFGRDRALWDTYTIDAFDTPNLAGVTVEQLRAIPLADGDCPLLAHSPRPYLTTRRWVWEKLHTWGESSPLWQSRVRGQFPEQSEDALISLAWLERAGAMPAALPERDAPAVAGLDVAGPGEDETVLTLRQGGHVHPPRVWAQPDPRGEVLTELRRWTIDKINVDSIGVGHYMARHLEDAGYRVVDVNVGEAPRDRERFANLKAELYWGLRERFETGEVTGLADDLTVGQCAGIRYGHNARGQVVIESKDQARKRGVKSPDRAESLMLAFAETGLTGRLVF
jgi:hypothetical protein